MIVSSIHQLYLPSLQDRTGDTFRWKGENVSTTEVETVVSNQVGLTDCVVYGVTVPGCEGRVGMAAIQDPEQKVKLDELLYKLKRALPAYAIPVFVRLVKKIETTGTFKLPKVRSGLLRKCLLSELHSHSQVALQRQGYDPQVISEPLYFLDSKTKSYVRLTQSLYEDILNGQIRF